MEGMRARLLPAFVLLVSAAALHPSWADLDVTLRNGDRVTGTIDPEAEVETYRFDLPRGAKLKVTAKGRKTRPRPDPPKVRLRLLDRFGRDISGDHVKTVSGGAKIRGFVAPESGEYAVEVRGDGFREGDYTLSLAWKTPKKLKFKNIDTSEGLQQLDFGADEGAEVLVKAKARKRSPSRPVVFQLLRVEAGGTTTVKTFTFPTDPQKTHEVQADIPKTGDHRLIVRDGGGAGGPTDVAVKVKTVKGRRDVDVTDDELEATPAGFEIASTILVDESGGATPDDVPALTIPRNAVTRLRPIQLGEGAPFDGPAGSGLLPLGDAAYVGPERVQFDRLVGIVLPYDPDLLPEGPSALRVVRLESTGLHTVLDAQSVVADEQAETASCPIGRGGLYGAFRLVPPPNPTSVTPFSGSASGVFPMTIGGSAFRDARDGNGDLYLKITLDGEVVNVLITHVSPTLVGFVAPPHTAGRVTFGILDSETGVQRDLPVNSFEYR